LKHFDLVDIEQTEPKMLTPRRFTHWCVFKTSKNLPFLVIFRRFWLKSGNFWILEETLMPFARLCYGFANNAGKTADTQPIPIGF
jgi:hypothetical protein